MTAQLSRRQVEWLRDAATEFASTQMKMTMKPEEVLQLTTALLGGMDSEPVAYIIQDKTDRKEGRSGDLSFKSVSQYDPQDINEHELTATPLYSVPPAPVAVPDDSAVELLATDLMKRIDKITGERHSVATLSSLRVSIVEACRAAMLKDGPVTAATVPEKCWCRTCRPVDITDMRFVVCPDCGNKRCPKANDHRNACSGSNEPGQAGSAYPASPVVGDFRERSGMSTNRSREHFISLCNQFWNWQESDEINAGDEEPRLEWNGKEFTHRVTQALWRMYQAAPEQE